MTKHQTTKSQGADAKAVKTRVLAVYDDFAELQDQCSFLCDAFSSLAREGEVVDEETIRGVRIYADCIKDKLGYIKKELKLIVSEVSLLTRIGAAE